MTRYAIAPALALFATPALAAKGPFFSLYNTDFVVVLAFLLFIGVLVYLKVPGKLMAMLDARAEGIRADLDEARKLREEAQSLLASYERKQKDVQEQADRIVAQAKDEAATAATKAKGDLARSIERRLAAAEDQIGSAQAAAIREVRNTAVQVAVAAAAEVVAAKMGATEANGLIDSAIAEVGEKLH